MASNLLSLLNSKAGSGTINVPKSQPATTSPVQKSNNDLLGFLASIGKSVAGTAQRVAGTVAQGAVALDTLPDIIPAALGDKNALLNAQLKNKMIDTINNGKAIDNGSMSFITRQDQTGKVTPIQFAKDFTNAGVNTASLLPAGRGVGVVTKGVEQGVKALTTDTAKQALINNAKQSLVYGTASTANDALQGTPITPGTVAGNYGLPLALGTGSEIIGRGLKDGIKPTTQLIQSTKPTTGLVQKVLASKPVQYMYGDKQVVQDAARAPITSDVVSSLDKQTVVPKVSAEVPPTSKLTTSPQVPKTSKEVLPSFDTNTTPEAYIKQQTKAQEAARKVGTPTIPTKVKTEFRTGIIDSLSPIEDIKNKAVKNGAKITLKNDITPQLDRVLRADTIGGQYIRDNGLAKVIQDAPDTKALDQYLIAKHAGDLEKNGVKTGRNLAADKQLVKQLAPVYEPHAQAVKEYQNKLLDSAVDYGLIPKELATTLKSKYPNYVPANRIFGEDELSTFKGNGSGKASISGQSVVQKIKGSNRQIESPLASIANRTQDVVKQGETNKAASILVSYKSLPDNPFNLRELKPSETIGTKSTISYLDKGKQRTFETTPEIATAAKSLNKEQIGILGKIVRTQTRILRLGATGLNAGFALSNLAKDFASAFINTEHPFEASIANRNALRKSFESAFNHGSQSYAELVREGAGGTSFDIARDAPRQTVAKIRAEKNVGTKIAYTVTHPIELLRAVENTIGRSEEFTRATQYFGNKEAALKTGASNAEARIYGANAARNNTVNFARAGQYGSVLNSAFPYLNAGIQGSRTLLRNIVNHPAQTISKIALIGALPTATTTAWNLSDPKRKAAYDDISDYEKQNNIIIVPPNPVKDSSTGRWNVIKIPVSQELANLNNIVRNGVEAAAGDGKLDPAELLGNLTGTVTSLNAQTPRQLVGQVIPQALKPAVESITNQNLYTGNNIVPDSQKNLPASDQYGKYTSGTAKTIGKVTGLSPELIDNTIKTAAGGAGQTAVNLSDQLLAATGVIKPNEVQGKPIGSSITDRFYGANSIPASQKADDAYQKARQTLIDTPEYKSLSQTDQTSALNRLQTDVTAIEYNKDDTANPTNGYTAKKLTANQQALANGTKSIASYTTKTPTASGLTSSNLDPKSASYNFLNDSAAITKTNQDTWNQTTVNSKYQKLVDNINSQLPQGAPQVPNTNAVAKIYATFEKNKADGNWSTLETQNKSQQVVEDAYRSVLTSQEQYAGTLSDTAIKDAVSNGQITKDQLDHIITVDNAVVGIGGSQNISNKTRAALGYGTVASKSSGSSSSGKSSSTIAKSFAAAQKATNDTALANEKSLQALLKGIKYTKPKKVKA